MIAPISRNQLLDSRIEAKLHADNSDEFSSIHVASFYGHSEFVKLLLSNGVDVNIRSRDNQDTPVILALHGYALRQNVNGVASTLRLLKERGADFEMKNSSNEMPWLIAFKSGVEWVKLLVEQCHLDINESIEVQKSFRGCVNSTPLVLASQLGHIEVVRYLLENKVKINAKVYQGWTALHEATKQGHTHVVDLLLSKDESIVNDVDSWGRTPLMIAAESNRTETMRMLMIKYGALTDCVTQNGKSFWDFILDGDDAYLKNAIHLYRDATNCPTGPIKFRPKCSPLHTAVGRIDAEDKIRQLISLGVDPLQKGKRGNTFYHVAARNNVVNVLRLTEFIRNSKLVESKNKNGNTPLLLAAQFGRIDAVQILSAVSNLSTLNA